jgi:hypothetical protein
MAPVMGDENREGEVMRCGHFQRGRRQGDSMVPEADDIANSGMAAQGGGCHLEVEDDQRKLGRWAECALGLNC